MAEIREAFGLDAPRAPNSPADAAEIEQGEASLDDAVEPPPVEEEAAPSATEGGNDADYLKAARRTAREAAAKAAAEEAQTGAARKKLTPKQRAILAARIKRRKEMETAAPAAEIADAPPVAERPAATPGAASSVKGRVTALLGKIKSKQAAQDAADADDAALDAANEKAAANPSLVAGATKALEKFKKIPNAGGVAGLGAAIVLLLVALFLMSKDKVGRADKPARAPAAATAPAATSDDRIAPGAAADATVRPRDLYLENIAALKSATTDGEARIALKRIEESAALGHPPAQLQLGELYKLGQLYERDLGQARQWFERAANGGNVLAMHRLGVMSARGEGGPVDPAASIKWFELAASFGLVDSQYNLGATYHPTADGAVGGLQDRGRAYFWYSVAANNGDAQAGEMAAGLASSMPAGEKSAKDAEVAAWAPKTPDPLANELAPVN
jgi:localization factor PodJL